MTNYKDIQYLLEQAVIAEQLMNTADSALCDKNPTLCSVANCNRRTYAKGFCNAHYLRQRKGQDLLTPVRGRKRADTCIDCGAITNSKGGWNRCTPCYSRRRQHILKKALVRYFGNKCCTCNESYPLVVYDFHHVYGNKIMGIGNAILDMSLERLAKEAAKCVLICSNCHRVLHEEERDNGRIYGGIQDNFEARGRLL